MNQFTIFILISTIVVTSGQNVINLEGQSIEGLITKGIYNMVEVVKPFAVQTNFNQTRGIIEDKIIALAEQLRVLLKSLDPLRVNNLDFNYDKNDIRLKGSITGKLEGFSDFILADLKFTIIGLIFKTAKLSIPEFNLVLDNYSLDAALGINKLFGDGTVNLKIKNLMLSIENLKLGISKARATTVFIEKIGNAEILMDDFEITITGWLHDENRSKLISKMINTFLPDIIKEYQPDMVAAINIFLKNNIIEIPFPL